MPTHTLTLLVEAEDPNDLLRTKFLAARALRLEAERFEQALAADQANRLGSPIAADVIEHWTAAIRALQSIAFQISKARCV